MIHRDTAATALTSQRTGRSLSVRVGRRTGSAGCMVARSGSRARKESKYMDVSLARSRSAAARLCRRRRRRRRLECAAAAAALNIDGRHVRLLSRVSAFQSTLHINCAVKVV